VGQYLNSPHNVKFHDENKESGLLSMSRAFRSPQK